MTSSSITVAPPPPATTNTSSLVMRGRSWSVRLHVRSIGVVFALVTATLAIGVWSIMVGDFPLSVRQVLGAVFGDGGKDAEFIVDTLRLPRALAGMMVGAALGMSGAVFQSIALVACVRHTVADGFDCQGLTEFSESCKNGLFWIVGHRAPPAVSGEEYTAPRRLLKREKGGRFKPNGMFSRSGRRRPSSRMAASSRRGRASCPRFPKRPPLRHSSALPQPWRSTWTDSPRCSVPPWRFC